FPGRNPKWSAGRTGAPQAIPGSAEPGIGPSEGHVNALELRVFVEAVAAEFTADAALLEAADGDFRRAIDDAVDPQPACIQAADPLERCLEVPRPHARRQAVFAVIGERDGLV